MSLTGEVADLPRGGKGVPQIDDAREFSLAERDRRWSGVRELAAAAGLDAIFVPLGNGQDAQYLTQLRNSCIILPTDGRSPWVVADRGQTSSWLDDVHQAVRDWAQLLTDGLRGLGLSRARLGVAGLSGGGWTHTACVEGSVDHAPYQYVAAQHPDATFADATAVVATMRAVKSEEEIERLAGVTKMAAAALDRVQPWLRPGLSEQAFHARLTELLLREGSSYRPSALSAGGRGVPRPGALLEDGEVIHFVIRTAVGGYSSLVAQSLPVGEGAAGARDVEAAHRDLYELTLDLARSGVTVGELRASFAKLALPERFATTLSIEGVGLGEDGPLVDPLAAASPDGLCLSTNNVLVLAPSVELKDDPRQRIRAGAPAIVTDRGCVPISGGHAA
jgi:Xaa-Pro aminopeptidase